MLRHYLRRAADRATQIIYARRKFKLLMKSNFRDIDIRVQELAAATNFFSSVVRPVVIEAPFGKSMMVVAPHQDDEVIGCGGAMALQCRQGCSTQVVVIQDGADEHEQVSLTRDQLRDMRNEESRAAARVINAAEPIFLGCSDIRRESESARVALREVITKNRVDTIFTPFILDGNSDHRACNVLLASVLREIDHDLRMLQYEVWANCVPNVGVVIDDVMHQKLEMLSCFHFANSALDYTHSTTGLNMLNSRMFPAGTARYVEAYFETPREEYLEIVDAVGRAVRDIDVGL